MDSTEYVACWDRCKNINVLAFELAEDLAVVPGSWNIQTGKWLRKYVYERLTPSGGKPTFITLLATQFVAAVWHGLYPGQILFFINTAIAIQVSRHIYKL